jgi:hypothetical protein
MNKMNILNIIIFFFLIFLGFYLSLIGGYGSDEDTLPMIGVFRSFLNSGHFMTSRFTGYPVAEFVIGFKFIYFFILYYWIRTFFYHN